MHKQVQIQSPTISVNECCNDYATQAKNKYLVERDFGACFKFFEPGSALEFCV